LRFNFNSGKHHLIF